MELKNIVFKTVGVEGLLKQLLKEVKGIKVALIYGSFAKNTEHAASDIDLLLTGDINEDSLIKEIKMTYEKFVDEYLAKGILKNQKSSHFKF